MTRPTEAEDHRSVPMRLTLLIQAVLVVGMGLFVWRGDWQNVFLTLLVIALTMLPMFLKRHRIIIPPEFQFVAALLLFLSLYLGSAQDYYYRFWWWDIVLHAGSGFLFGIIGFLAIYLLNQTDRIPRSMQPTFVCLFAVMFSVFIGVLWEIVEYAVDSIWPSTNMQSGEEGVRDTMNDMIVNLVGAIVVAGIGWAYLKTGKQSFISDAVRAFVKRNPRLFRTKKRA
jgi:uncharacterized membrane protein